MRSGAGAAESSTGAGGGHHGIHGFLRGGSKELVINKDYGMIIENNSEELLLPALEEAINDKEGRIHATKLSYQRLCENFTWDTVERKVEMIMDEFNK